MEYLLVEFPLSRSVVINDVPQGKTGQVIELPKGTYTVSLDPSTKMRPKSKTIELSDTSPLSPKVVRFAKTK